MSRFWQDALELLDGDARLIQEVITLLAGDGGMLRIAELLDQPFEKLSDSHLARVFEARLLPFFNTITHRNVTASAILEGRLITIYNYVFGPDGYRAVKLFQVVCKHLSTLTLVSLVDDISMDGKSISSFEATIAALSRLIEVNTMAQVNEGFPPIVEALSGLLSKTPDTFSTRNVSKQLARVQQRLG